MNLYDDVDPLPAELSGGLTGESEDVAAGPVTSMSDPAARSTLTGRSLKIGTRAVCGTTKPVALPVLPGATGQLPATGSPWRLALLGAGLVLLATSVLRRRTTS